MTGLAKKLFSLQQPKDQGLLWGKKSKYTPCKPWPCLEKLLESSYFCYIDYAFTEKLLRNLPHAGEAEAACLLYLFLTARQGHLCMQVDEGKVTPHPAVVHLSVASNDLENKTALNYLVHEEALEQLARLIVEGFQKLPFMLFEDILFRKGALIYLRRYWTDESLFIAEIRKREKELSLFLPDLQIVHQRLAELQQEGKLLKEQAEAIERACLKNLMVITGGPGTGKTYTAAHLVALYWESLDAEQRSSTEIVLAAPTGKATARLYEGVFKLLQGHPLLELVSAKTLHSLLGARLMHSPSLVPHSPKGLTANFLLIDESSMVDAKLMAQLLHALPPAAKIVFLGDRDQLPPVGAGSLFADLVTAFEKRASLDPAKIGLARLSRCMRSELKEIVELASHIREGDADQFLERLNCSSTAVKRLSFDMPLSEFKHLQQKLVQMILSKFSTVASPFDHFKEVMDQFNAFRLLSPLRKGLLGVDELNNCCLQKLQSKGSKMSRPIMVTANDYRLGLFNGEMGVLAFLGKEAWALFPEKEEGKFRKFLLNQIPQYEYAFALSVHKSQGSEFDEVLLLMPEGAEIFGREVLYTAVTRAKKLISIYGSDAVLTAAIKRQSSRFSGISTHL